MVADLEFSKESIITIKMSQEYAYKVSLSLTRILSSMNNLPNDTQGILINQGVVDHLIAIQKAIDTAKEVSR